jgi:hypothetical protein
MGLARLFLAAAHLARPARLFARFNAAGNPGMKFKTVLLATAVAIATPYKIPDVFNN